MNAWLKLQPHPFRLLLYLEWILLGLSAFKLFGIPGWGRPVLMQGTEVFSSIATKPLDILAFAILLASFGIMGLRLPIVRWMKWTYLAIGSIIIGIIAQLQGWGLDALSPLLIIILLRSSAIFGQNGRWTIAALVWLVYPLTLFPIMVIWAIIKFAPRDSWHQDAFPGLTVLPNGGAQFSRSFTPEQVQQFFDYLQHVVLYYLVDALLSFGLILIFVLLLVNSLFKERQGRRQLTLAHEQLYQYSLQIEDQATLQERTRIAREIHDTLGHLLTAQSVVLENAALSLKTAPQEAEPFLLDSKRLGREARQELRQAILMLRSDPLNGLSFEAAIAHLCHEFDRITQIQPMLDNQLKQPIPERHQVAIYRIIKEALTNIQKHSEATQVWIQLEMQSRLNDSPSIKLKIKDNGKGFDLQQNQTGFGLQGMRERVESLGGELTIKGTSGCQVTALFPLLVSSFTE